MESPDLTKLRANMTWDEITAYVEDWIRYGDDPFDDTYSHLYELHKDEKDAEMKKVYESVLRFMDMLRKYMFC